MTETRIDSSARDGAPGIEKLRIGITGAGGLLGSALVSFLAASRHDIIRLVRRPVARAGEVRWDPERGVAHPAALEGCDAVVHLAGEGIADSRWTQERRRAIEVSRIDGTRTLCTALAGLSRPPKVMISASAIGVYGNRGDEILNEASATGSGFLADLARRWEAEAMAAERFGARVVVMRTGLVLTARGGVLRSLLPPFRLGVGGPLGDGSAWWSWIALDDWVGLVDFVLTREGARGPWNAVAPEPVTNREFARTLARVLRRPAFLPAPRWALELMFGEMAREAILGSQRVEPEMALGAGYRFRFTELESTLRHALGRPAVVVATGTS